MTQSNLYKSLRENIVLRGLLVSLNLSGRVDLTLLALLLLNITNGRAESFRKLILELIHLGGVLRVIEVYGGLKFLNL
jgi:hypothetical protein